MQTASGLRQSGWKKNLKCSFASHLDGEDQIWCRIVKPHNISDPHSNKIWPWTRAARTPISSVSDRRQAKTALCAVELILHKKFGLPTKVSHLSGVACSTLVDGKKLNILLWMNFLYLVCYLVLFFSCGFHLSCIWLRFNLSPQVLSLTLFSFPAEETAEQNFT